MARQPHPKPGDVCKLHAKSHLVLVVARRECVAPPQIDWPSNGSRFYRREKIMADNETTVAQLRQMVEHFVSERDWKQFHSPKNLSMALAIEAAELMEHFQWLEIDESRAVATDRSRREAAGEELADVICYALALANELGLDVSRTMQQKMEKNIAKYPVGTFRGRWRVEDSPPSQDG